jgi:hypothetical protein
MVIPVRSAEELVKRALVEPGLLDRIKADPVHELPELAAKVVADLPASPPLESDVWIYRMVVAALGASLFVSLLGAIVLVVVTSKDTPPVLVALGSAAVGALAGLLAPSPAGK